MHKDFGWITDNGQTERGSVTHTKLAGRILPPACTTTLVPIEQIRTGKPHLLVRIFNQTTFLRKNMTEEARSGVNPFDWIAEQTLRLKNLMKFWSWKKASRYQTKSPSSASNVTVSISLSSSDRCILAQAATVENEQQYDNVSQVSGKSHSDLPIFQMSPFLNLLHKSFERSPHCGETTVCVCVCLRGEGGSSRNSSTTSQTRYQGLYTHPSLEISSTHKERAR